MGFVHDVLDRRSILLLRYVIESDSNAQSFDGVVSGHCIHVGNVHGQRRANVPA
jgi:hypothetical protein